MSDPVASTEPLGRFERGIALMVGIAAGGGGGYAVFASSNQAGTAILLVLSAIFLVVGIQGTSLIRFSTGSNTFELERRKRGVEKAVAAIAREDPDRAAGIIEGAEIALPNLGSFSASQAVVYEERIAAALSGLGYLVSSISRPGFIFPDFILMERGGAGQAIHVEVKYRSRSHLDSKTVAEVIARANSQGAPFLLVTNAEFSERAAAVAANEATVPSRVVQWRDDFDNSALQQALAELFGSP